MKIEDLKDTKIYLDSVSDRVKFKSKLEELGLEWDFDLASDPIRNNTPFFFIDMDLDVFAYRRESCGWFCEDKRKQIFLEDVLSIEEPKEEYKFKPFDKVLVRDDNLTTEWLPSWYAFFDTRQSSMHLTTGGCAYEHCIPYEGNEHLAGTTKNP